MLLYAAGFTKQPKTKPEELRIIYGLNKNRVTQECIKSHNMEFNNS